MTVTVTPRRLLTALLALLSLIALAACSDEQGGTSAGGDQPGGSGGSGGDALRIVAATELEDLVPVVEAAADDLGFAIELSFPDGTLANSQTLLAGGFDGEYDATWFATNRYVDLIGAADKLVDSTKIGTSPVAFGIAGDTARELGWDTEQPTWAEIAEAAADEELTFGMTDPSSSNSGFSALVSVATALADTGTALTLADIDRVAPQLEGFFGGQSMTSGSSGWLRDTFLQDPSRADALVNYESVLHGMRREGADLEVIVPADGVVSADYPLSTLAEPADSRARERVAELGEWLLERPELMTDSFRRPVDAATPLPDELDSQLLIELPFPGNREITDRLVDAYNHELRNPGSTAFVLDTSGSMSGSRLDQLKEVMVSLIDGTAATSTGAVGLRDRENVTVLPFDTYPGDATTVRYSTSDPAVAGELRGTVEELSAEGGTGIYTALRSAYDALEVGDDTISSIVLMSDGEHTGADSLAEFADFHAGLPAEQRSIPVFVILYGEANVDEMTGLTELTGGRVFDALSGDLDAAFKEIRGYQ